MDRKDAWFLGLFALAYLYLDTLSTPRLPAPAPRRLLPPGPGTALVPVVPPSACPRSDVHPVSVRGDGAIWCRSCDEAFYPGFVILETLHGGVAA